MPPAQDQRLRRLALPGLFLAFLLMAIVPRALGAPGAAIPHPVDGEPCHPPAGLIMLEGRGVPAAPEWLRLRMTPAAVTALPPVTG